MPYKINAPIQTNLQIEINGEIFTVDAGVGNFQGTYRQAKIELLESFKRLQKTINAEKAQAELGTFMIALLKSVFGDVQTDRILDIYKEDYTYMLACLLPWFNDELEPMLNKMTEEKRETYKNYAKYGKKKRRWFK